MAQLSFQFQYQYEQSSERVFIPIRLRSGNVVTTPLLPHLDTGSPANVFRAEIAEILNIAYEQPRDIIRMGTAGGGSFLAYGHKLTLEVIGSTLQILPGGSGFGTFSFLYTLTVVSFLAYYVFKTNPPKA